MIFPESIKIVEVGPRDGLQNECTVFNIEQKLQLINSLIDSGIKNIEVTSFVHPKIIPQLADAERLLELIPWNKDVNYNALVPNEKGFERSAKTNLREITVFLSASESHNKKNTNCSISDSLRRIENICRLAKESDIKIRAIIATAFGCPFEGEVPVERVLLITKELYRMGCYEVALGDTIGVANPRQVFDVFNTIRKELPELSYAAHFHDTNKMALANVVTAMQAGVEIFDSSIGGLGGCPFAPGATGNVSTENLVYMLNKMNIETGINLKKLINSISLIEEVLNRKIELIPEFKKIKK